MDKNFYALGYRPQELNFGKTFLFDGENDFEYWKKQNPGVDYKEYWKLRDTFVHNNRVLVDNIHNNRTLADNVHNYPVKNVANFFYSNDKNARIAQVIASNGTWEKVKNITNSNGTIISFDTETIGDVERNGFYKINNSLQSYDGYAGVTEIGFSVRQYVDGDVIGDINGRELTLAVGLSKDQLRAARTALNTYENHGLSSLDKNQIWMLKWFSQYGNGHYSSYFGTDAIDFLGNKKFVTINVGAMKAPDIHDFNAIRRGINNWSFAMSDKSLNKYMGKEHVLGSAVEYIQSNLDDPTSALTGSNIGYDITVLQQELKNTNIKFNTQDAQKFFENTADIVYANEAIAASEGISVYKMQTRTGNKIKTVGKPASQQASQEAAGLGDESHIAGSDAGNESKVSTNKRFRNGEAFADQVLEANKINTVNQDYENNYYVFKSGFLDKNKMDHAIVDGEETQSYSYRNRYLSIDLENSGYVSFTPQAPEGVSVEPKDVYILSMIDEQGNKIRKQFDSEYAAYNYIDTNSMAMPKKFVNKRVAQRTYQDKIADIDLARREYDRLMNIGDIATNKGKEVNGFAGLQKYLELIDEVDKVGIDKVSDEVLSKYEIKSSTQKQTFKALYTRLESEKDALKNIVNYVNERMPSSNNTQKTMALNKIMNAYKEEIASLGFESYIPEHSSMILEDALGIDIGIKISDTEYEHFRINGNNEQTIQRGLERVFKGHNKEDIIDSMFELTRRGVLSEDAFNQIKKDLISNVTPRDSYYHTVFSDIANRLSSVMEPITTYKYGPISFFNNIENKENIGPILNKTTRSIRDEVLQYEKTAYRTSGKNKIYSLSEITSTNDFWSRIQPKVDNIIESVNETSFITSKNQRNKLLAQMGDELGYSHEQKKMLVQMFEAREGKKKGGAYKPYAIDGYKELHSFIIPPSANSSGSGFLLIANDSTQASVAQTLFDSKATIQGAETRKDIEKIIGEKATIIELKKFDKANLGDFDKYGIPKELANFIFGDEKANVTTIKQGRYAQKFVTPAIDAYEYKGKINIDIKQPGDELLSSYRKSGVKIIDYTLAGEFGKATRAAYQTSNEYIRDLSSPSSGRAYLNEANELQRAINYNLNDLSHAFYLDGSGVRKAFELEAKKAVTEKMYDSPIYKMVETIGIFSGNLGYEEQLDLSSLESILKSGEWNEFYVKNLFTGIVAEDKTFAEQIVNFGIADELSSFKKNIFDLMLDFSQDNSDMFSKESIETFQKIKQISPYLSQILSETNVGRDMWTLLKPGDIVNLGGINTTLRPTYIQILNALRFNPNDVTYLPEDSVMGGLSRTKIEQFMMDNIDIKAPSGLPYNTQERLITTTFKQMSDFELQLKYRELGSTIDEIAAKSNLDPKKLKAAFDIFVSEHPSIYKDKMFGAPKLHNQFPFMSPDVKKISMPRIAKLQGEAREQTVSKLGEYLKEGKILNRGDIIGFSDGQSLYWEGPATKLTVDNVKELLEEGETKIVPYGRMVSDTKWMIQQEKATVHFTIIDDVFLKENPIFENSKKIALDYMQKVFDLVAGYDGVSGYQPGFLGNISPFKHGTNLATDSVFSVIVNEYRKAGRLNQLAMALNSMEGFKGWDFEVQGYRLNSDQMNKSGIVNAIHKLHDIVVNDETGYGLNSEVNAKIASTLEYMKENKLVHLEAQRSNVNEIMGTSVTLDERMQQAIRLRAVNDGTYYVGEYEIEVNGVKKKVKAVDGILDGVNGVVINDVGKSWDDLYLDELKYDISKGVYDTMDTSEFNESGFKGLGRLLKDISEDKQANFASHRKMVKDQESIIGGLKEAILHYDGRFDVDAHDVIRVDMDDLLKRLPQRGGISSDDLQDFIFKIDGKPSNYLTDLTGGVVNNKSAMYLDFGTEINGRKGIMLPLLNVNTSDDEVFFNRIQSSIVRFFNVYKDNIGLANGKDEISNTLDTLFNSFARELVVFDKDSLAYKTMSRIVLPNSSQSLAQDEIAPLVDALLNDDSVRESIELEKDYRRRIINGETEYVKELDDLLAERKIKINEAADIIEFGEILDDSGKVKIDEAYYNLSGLSTIGRADKGYADYIVSTDGMTKPIRYTGQKLTKGQTIELPEGQTIKRFFTNSFDTSIENLRAHSLDTGVITLQLLNDFTENGKLTKYESNKNFDAFMSSLDKTKIVSELQQVVRDHNLDIDVNENNIMKSIDEYVVNIRTLNEELISKNKIKKADTKAFDDIMTVLNKFGIAEEYLSEVGILTREMNRPPIFKSQNIARIYLNKTLHGQEIRANNPVTSVVTNVDHDGDMYMSSLDLNGGGIRTVSQQAKLIAAYENSLPTNNKILANVIREAEVFASDDITDIELFRLKELERLDRESYLDNMQAWIEKNNIHSSVNDLTEGQILQAAHSRELRFAYETFDAVGNRLTNEDIIKASLVTRARKNNIGSISTPNYKLRDTLLSVTKNKNYQDVDRLKAFRILKNLTDISGSKLLDVTEQKGIDVKHIYDAVNIAETPKWTKGMSMLFNKKHNVSVSQQGLHLMMEAVNNSTFKFKEKEKLELIYEEILNNSMDAFKNEMEEAIRQGNKDLAIIAQFKLEFRALYESIDLPNVQAIHKSVFRNKNVIAKDMAEALAVLDYDLTQASKGTVMDDFYKTYIKEYSDVNLLIDDTKVYFKSGDIVDENTLLNRAFILEKATSSSVKLREVDLDTLRPTKRTEIIDGLNYKQLNKKLKEFLDDIDGVDKYVYANNSSARKNVAEKLKTNKFNRTMNAILFNTGYENSNGFDAFHKFTGMKTFDQLKLGQEVYDKIGSVIGTTQTITEARELINDFQWAKSEGRISGSLPALIKQLNKDIAEHPERFQRPDGLGIQDYDEILRSYFTNTSNGIFGSENLLNEIRQKRLALKTFDNDAFEKNKIFLKTNAYDIITSETLINDSYDNLTKLSKAFTDDSVPEELKKALADKEKNINEILGKAKEHNQAIVKKAQQDTYALFKKTDFEKQMDIKFNWASSRKESMVGFGEYLGTTFDELKQADITRILATDISDNALKQMDAKQAYATRKTVELLKKYTGEVKAGTALHGRPVIEEAGNLFRTQEKLYYNIYNNLTEEAKKKAFGNVKKKTISGSLWESIKSIDIKSKAPVIGAVAAGLAALGVANNLLHNQKNQSPLTPARRPNGNGAPDINGNYPETSVPTQAPMSQKRVIYHDKNSGFNFKVSARTNNYINDQNNAKLIGMSGGGNASIYSQSDTSGVTDNWLANKFAELT